MILKSYTVYGLRVQIYLEKKLDLIVKKYGKVDLFWNCYQTKEINKNCLKIGCSRESKIIIKGEKYINLINSYRMIQNIALNEIFKKWNQKLKSIMSLAIFAFMDSLYLKDVLK